VPETAVQRIDERYEEIMKFMSAVTVQEYDAARVKRWTLWSGRILSAFGVFILLSSITAKLTHNGGRVGCLR
jgi:hypothetical protein